jgi:hypothetical protein
MLQTFRLLIAAGWLAALCASCTPKPPTAPPVPGYKENPY